MAGVAPAPICVLGATGYTGKLVLEALERLERGYVVAGRREAALREIAAPHCQGVRPVDATDPAALEAAFQGVGAVINCVGPFARLGRPVVEAAIAAGVHYTDTSAETGYLQGLASLDDAARAAGVAVVPGNGCDFGLAFLGAAVLAETLGGLDEVFVHQWMDGFVPSRGTAESALASLKAPNLVLRDGQLHARHDLGVHRKLVQDLDGWAVPWPGAEPVALPWDYPELRRVESYLVLHRHEALGFAVGGKLGRRLPNLAVRGLARLGRRLPEPREDLRRRAVFRLVMEGVRGEDLARFRLDVPDVYGITADLVAITAQQLADRGPRRTGVRTTGAALDPHAVLAALGPRGLTLTLPSAPVAQAS